MNIHSHSTLEQKQNLLFEILREAKRVVIAFSAGVDSTVLLKAAQLAKEPEKDNEVVAVIADSPSLPSGTLEEAEQLTQSIGTPLVILKTKEFSKSDYQANQGNRCYFCKESLYETIKQHHTTLQYDVIFNGANTDDLGDYRPGLVAAKEHDVRSPFVEAEISKKEIRELAKQWELPVWDKPASPCLSSRIAHGLEVTEERVKRVDQAERFLKETFKIRELRVRHEFHDLARIEVPIESLSRLIENEHREKILEQLKEFGFKYITIDLAGFRSGSMNQVLPLEVLTNSL